MYVYAHPHVEVREQLAGIEFLLPSCGFQGSNSGLGLAVTESSHWPTDAVSSVFINISFLAAIFRMCTIRSIAIGYLLSA